MPTVLDAPVKDSIAALAPLGVLPKLIVIVADVSLLGAHASQTSVRLMGAFGHWKYATRTHVSPDPLIDATPVPYTAHSATRSSPGPAVVSDTVMVFDDSTPTCVWSWATVAAAGRAPTANDPIT